jgi:hypothetical protein
MKMLVCRIALLSFGLVGTACSVTSKGNEELAAKQEYSLLQGYEHDFRNSAHHESYIVIREARGTRFNLVGLPISDRNSGYLWIVANPNSPPEVKQLPTDARFKVTKRTFEGIQGSVDLSPAIEAYLSKSLEQ